MGRGFRLSSGRVIGVGRLLLAALFTLAVYLDERQPERAADAAYAVLGGYLAFAAAILLLTWRNWWRDAQLAGPAHAVDILFFTLLVVAMEGYTSPYFPFFAFLLLSAAIRWSWRATALTALLLMLLYLLAGLLAAGFDASVDLDRFIVRTSQLTILSLVLIWFGANQWRLRLHQRGSDGLAHPTLDQSPIESGLRAAMATLRARSGTFLWRSAGAELSGLSISDDSIVPISTSGESLERSLDMTPFLYDLRRERALSKDSKGNLRPFEPSDAIVAAASAELDLTEGLAVPVRTGEGAGILFLERVRGLSTDHVDLGEQLAGDLAAHLQSHALLRAVDENAEARSRLSLARDLHDSVVQFLAGAAFRLEAMRRSESSGEPVGRDLDELKQLMLDEQRELRFFITALRSGSQVALEDLAKDLKALAGRLAVQWGIRCELESRVGEMTIPTRLHLDALQMTREAVANAVRHAGAKAVSISLAASPEQLELTFINDGAAFPGDGAPEMPGSLQERVEQARGSLDLSRGMGLTRVIISLPVTGGRQ